MPFHLYIILALFNLNQNSGVEKVALGKGIKGFFYKTSDLKILLKGIESILKGQLWIPRDILSECALNSFKQKRIFIKKQTSLTQREIEILNMIGMGASNEEIADKMCIALNTVKTHLYKIYRKINVKNRLGAALWASKNL